MKILHQTARFVRGSKATVVKGGLILLVVILGLTAILRGKFPKKKEPKAALAARTPSSSYVEYAFDSERGNDPGFTKRAYDQMRKSHTLLDAESAPLRFDEMPVDPDLKNGAERGVFERRVWNGNAYELVLESGSWVSGVYRMSSGTRELFRAPMRSGAEGPIHEWRIIDGKPAFTFGIDCPDKRSGAAACTDIWHDGEFLSKKYRVNNPRYPFSYGGKLGFIATRDFQDAVFYDGVFLTPSFRHIWTRNCCAAAEILPTVYENGVLLFYALRGENYLVEANLQELSKEAGSRL